MTSEAAYTAHRAGLVYLHIGLEKTGSTTIQNFLACRRKALLDRGILFPNSPGNGNHSRLAAYARDDLKIDDIRKSLGITDREQLADFRASFEQTLIEEVQRARPSVLLLSNEHCSSRLVGHEEIERLCRLLERVGKRLKVVVYLRRQDELLLSTYSTEVKAGGHTHELRVPRRVAGHPRYDYRQLLDNWSAVVGREDLIVRVFEKHRFPAGGLLGDFMQAVGLELDGPDAESRLNESLDAQTLEFLRLLNRHVPKFHGMSLNPARRELSSVMEGISRGDKKGILGGEGIRERIARFYDQCRVINRQVAARYLNEEGEVFSAPFELGDRIHEEPLCLDAAMEIFARIWNVQQARYLELLEENRLLKEQPGTQSRLRS